MKTSMAIALGYAIMIVWLSGAWGVAVFFFLSFLTVIGLAQLFIAFLSRYHAHLIQKIVENELILEEQNEQVS
jgi:uncharacterized membrane protein